MSGEFCAISVALFRLTDAQNAAIAITTIDRFDVAGIVLAVSHSNDLPTQGPIPESRFSKWQVVTRCGRRKGERLDDSYCAVVENYEKRALVWDGRRD